MLLTSAIRSRSGAGWTARGSHISARAIRPRAQATTLTPFLRSPTAAGGCVAAQQRRSGETWQHCRAPADRPIEQAAGRRCTYRGYDTRGPCPDTTAKLTHKQQRQRRRRRRPPPPPPPPLSLFRALQRYGMQIQRNADGSSARRPIALSMHQDPAALAPQLRLQAAPTRSLMQEM